MTANSYDELSRQRLDHGRGYEKRSVETFRARALDVVDELLRHVTELEDRLAAGRQPAMSEAESDLLRAFRLADALERQEALGVLERSSGTTGSPAHAQGTSEHVSIDRPDRKEWFTRFGEGVAPTPVIELDLRTPEPPLRIPLRVGLVDRSSRPPTPPTSWGGWVD